MRIREGLVGLGMLAVLSTSAAAGLADADADAQRLAANAALGWLQLIDSGRYAESWKEASAYFRRAITEAGWDAALRGVRAPLGAVQSRGTRTTKEATTLPGAPDGHYVVMEFATSFANKASAIETVTFTREPDGRWRAAGYYIR
ncbi:MAG TPA: DUF4019 domain-containing protein [Candidatus Methylomirabilis sp.]|nr:DUF4019 domain-containing protein [Candidatus Methylomirabilis sp.]